MSDYSSLKATINANIKANNNHEITGAITNSVLNAMVDSLGAGYQFMGVATPTNPGTAQTPDYKCFYLATTPGTYTNLGGLVVAEGEVAILKYDTAWTKEVTGVATADQVSQLGQEIHSGTIYMDSLKRENFIIGDNPVLIRTAGAYSRVFAISSSLIKRVKIIPGAVGTAIVSFVQDVDFITDETITTVNFSISIPHRMVITSEVEIEVPIDCKYIVCTDESAGTIYTPVIEVYSGVDFLKDTLDNIVCTVSNKDCPDITSFSHFTRLISYPIKSGHKYKFINNCGQNISVVTVDENGNTKQALFSGIITGSESINVANYDATYIKLYAESNVSTPVFEVRDITAFLDNTNNRLKDKTEARIDNQEYVEIPKLISNADQWVSVGSGTVTRLFPAKEGAIYKIATNPSYNQKTKRIAFLNDDDDITPNFVGDIKHVFYNEEDTVYLKCPEGAFYIAVFWASPSATIAPLVYEITDGEFVFKNEIENIREVRQIEFINAQLYGEEIEFVERFATTNDKAVNVSKELLYCPFGGVVFNVSNGYKIAFITYNSDYKANGIFNNTWYTGQGAIMLNAPYCRVYVKSTTDNTIITPDSGYTVELSHTFVNYGRNKEYYLIAAQDSDENYKNIADFIAGEDARPALQIAADEAYIHGTKLLVAPGTYELNSSLNNAGNECLSFSQFVSSKQYNNPYQGVTIEGLRKPSGYVGDAAIIKMSDTLYASVNSTFNIIQTDPCAGNDWRTFFITSMLNLKNLIIQVPNNQKPIHAIHLGYAEGGSRLEGLRIIGIPLIDGVYFPEHANENSVGIVSNPGSTFNTNSYWDDIEVHGFYYGVHIVGMEHAFIHNLTVQWCEYGLKFNGGGQHPIQLIAVQDEHNVNLPDFGEAGRAIEISGYNASWPENAPGFPNAETEGWYQRKRATGNPIGSIEYTNNITPTGGISTPVDYPTYFEHGQGLNMKVRNMKHSLSGTSVYRRSIAPNYLQRYYDTDVNKELICVDTQNKTWVDTQGNIVP